MTETTSKATEKNSTVPGATERRAAQGVAAESRHADEPLQVFDLHCDTIDTLALADTDVFASVLATRPSGDMAANDLQLAAERMRSTARWCQCYAAWIPDDARAAGLTSHGLYRKVADYFLAQVGAHSNDIARITDTRDIDGQIAEGRVAAMLTVENGSPLEEGLGVLDEMVADGVRMITLTWNGQNCIGSGNDTHEGLSRYGRDVVRHMEEARVVVDVSHLNDEGFSDFLACSRRPFVASHSNSRAICDNPRNLTDDEFRAICDREGLVGINYYRAFVSPRFQNDERAEDVGEVTFEELARHVEHFLDLGGEGVLALGSDFDGSDTPAWLANDESLPGLFEQLCARFGEGLSRRIFFQNAHDFFLRNETA
ncbi:MAG: membrane dipeptidase [Olsenella sp.]|nr:membrane dipeptidase [Olsenella sp.]